MNELDNKILQASGDVPMEQPIEQPIQQDVPPVPQFDPREMQAHIEYMHQRQQMLEAKLAEQQAYQPPKQLTPDEEIAQDVRRKLGLDALSEEIKAIKAHNEQLQAERVMQQQQQYVGNLVSKYGEQAIQSVEAELRQMARFNPELAKSLNTPQGVEYLLSKQQVQPQKQPDAVIPSGNSTVPMGNQTAFNNIASGKFNDEDIFSALSAHMK